MAIVLLKVDILYIIAAGKRILTIAFPPALKAVSAKYFPHGARHLVGTRPGGPVGIVERASAQRSLDGAKLAERNPGFTLTLLKK